MSLEDRIVEIVSNSRRALATKEIIKLSKCPSTIYVYVALRNLVRKGMLKRWEGVKAAYYYVRDDQDLIDIVGLGPTQREVLRLLASCNRPMRGSQIASELGRRVGTEPTLMGLVRRGLVERTNGSYIITEKGRKALRYLEEGELCSS